MSLAKLTSQSTQTLSLLLERQRLQTLSPSGQPTSSNLHLPQIARNLKALRQGILDLEQRGGQDAESAGLLRNQYERMRGMLGRDVLEDMDIESLEREDDTKSVSGSSTPDPRSSLTPSPQPPFLPTKDSNDVYRPYTDDPEAQYSNDELMQLQRDTMNEQDTHLDRLSHSINRQRDISLQINDELEVHSGLLERLDTDLESTGSRLSRARRRLDRVAKGLKGNGSTVTIVLLILVLLILIIVFKT